MTIVFIPVIVDVYVIDFGLFCWLTHSVYRERCAPSLADFVCEKKPIIAA